MMKQIIHLALLAGTTLSMASSLSIYQDKTLYSYTPQSSFIGLTKGVKAKCEGESISFSHTFVCPENGHLCKLYTDAEAVEAQILSNRNNMALLEKLIKLPQPNSVNAAVWVEAAKLLAREQTKLALEKKRLSHESRKLKQRFNKQTRANMPLALDSMCKGELELTLPYGYVTFATEYEATLLDGRIEVTQKLSVLNRSGIDIEANEAHFYYRSARQYVRPIYFSPWIVGERRAYLSKNVKRSRKIMVMDDAEEMHMDAPTAAATAPQKVRYEDAREYTIENLKLPSTGESKSLPVMTWKVPVKCQTELFAYRNSNAFEVCSFKPKFQIEQNRWKITKNGKIVNESAVGEYKKENYRLYTQIDQDIKIIRKKIVRKERETGIFGGTARKKDGFILTIINKSNKEKKLLVTERIPSSTTEKIKVKLLSVHSDKAVDYNLLKDGKLKMNVVLVPHEARKIEVLFEISYDKDLKIDY